MSIWQFDCCQATTTLKALSSHGIWKPRGLCTCQTCKVCFI